MARIITITGDLGSGKSTVAKSLASRLGFNSYSTGKVQREIARKRNITTLQLNELSEKDPSIDEEIDSVFISLKNDNEDLVVDSRMAWFFLPSSYKVKLVVSDTEASRRVMNDKERKSESLDNINEVLINLRKRKSSEIRRFKAIYHADLENNENFDLIVDTGSVSPDEIVELITAQSTKYFEKEKVHQFWSSPKCLYPLKSVSHIIAEAGKEVRESISSSGFDHNQPIECIRDKSGNLYLVNGYKRASGAILESISLVPIMLQKQASSTQTADEYLRSEYDASFVYDWEDAHKFKFPHYPELGEDKVSSQH